MSQNGDEYRDALVGHWGEYDTADVAATVAQVNALHAAGIGVLVDWVPAHFPRDGWALARSDGTALYEHEDPRLGEHPDWGTYIFNYGRFEVRAHSGGGERRERGAGSAFAVAGEFAVAQRNEQVALHADGADGDGEGVA